MFYIVVTGHSFILPVYELPDALQEEGIECIYPVGGKNQVVFWGKNYLAILKGVAEQSYDSYEKYRLIDADHVALHYSIEFNALFLLGIRGFSFSYFWILFQVRIVWREVKFFLIIIF